MRRFYVLLVFLVNLLAYAQVNDSLIKTERTVKVNDPFYREDQFYLGITHSMYLDAPSAFKQNSISSGFQAGILRDISINEKRNWAIATGVGFSTYNMRTNLLVLDPITMDYELNSNYTKNKQNHYFIDVPLEVRWRSSNRYSHKFWRIYTGVRYSYLLASSTKYDGYYGMIEHKNDRNLLKSQIGMYVSAGFNTWNLQVYYGFTPLYKNTVVNGAEHLKMLNIGLMFYIL